MFENVGQQRLMLFWIFMYAIHFCPWALTVFYPELFQANIPISTYPLYHSSYETFYAFDAFIDPGFTATAAITKLMAILAMWVLWL